MALEQCPECGKDISTTAESCPHCGFQDQSGKVVAAATSTVRIILMVLAFLSVVSSLLLGGCFGLIVPVSLFFLAVILK